jgi:hypothetical protein
VQRKRVRETGELANPCTSSSHFFLATCILLLSNGLTFPRETFHTKKALPSQANDLFRVSICIALFFLALSKEQSSSACFVTHLFLTFLPFITAALLLLRFAIPRIPAHVSSPHPHVSFFFFFSIIIFLLISDAHISYPHLSGLVLHGWSHGGFYSEKSIAMGYHFKMIEYFSSYDVGCYSL